MASIFYTSSAVNKLKYDKLRMVTNIAAAENFIQKLNKTNELWNIISSGTAVSPVLYSELYLCAEIASEELSKFTMRDDVKRSVQLYLAESSEAARTAIDNINALDSAKIEETAGYSSKFAELFGGAEISPSGEVLFPDEAIPENMILKILGEGKSRATEIDEGMTYYLKQDEEKKAEISKKKASDALGISSKVILQPAYSEQHRMFFCTNAYIETSDDGTQIISLIFDKDVPAQKLTESECAAAAEDYLKVQGFTDYTLESSIFADNIFYADFHTAADSKKITIGITSDTGKAVFFKKSL